MTNVQIMWSISEELMAELRAEFPNCNFSTDTEMNQNTEIVWGVPSIDTINSYPSIRWVQSLSAGVDNYPKDKFPKGVILTNSTGSYGQTISEHMLATHLMLEKRLHLYRDQQHEMKWKHIAGMRGIKGSTVLVLGLGDIGGDYAKLIKALGGYVIGIRRSDTRKPDYVDELYLSDKIEELLPRADVVAIALPKTDKTDNLINEKTISLMKDGVLILNVGRGSIIDTEALCDGLESGKISGAGLDVTSPEPLPYGHRLWKMQNAIITPHISGGVNVDETKWRIIEIFRENLRKYFDGKELTNTIDFDEGYRKLSI